MPENTITATAPIGNVPKEIPAIYALNYHYRWLILLGLILAAIMEILDTTIINVALPQMSGNLGTTTQEIAWVSTAYILANVVVLPMTSFFTAIFGRRAYMTGSIILFTVASVFCGTSNSLGEIIVWRLLQGAGGAALISTAQAAMVQIFPPEEQSIVQPAFFMGIVVAPTIGPVLGGFITDAASWNWCFFINIPIGILAGSLVYWLMKDQEPAKPDTPIDYLGIVLLTVSLAGLQYVLEEGESNDWFADPTITRVAIAAGLSIMVLIPWLLSSRNQHPIVNLRVLKNTSLTTGIILFMAVGLGLYGVNYLYPLLAQVVEGLTPAQSGMSLLPGGLTTAFSIVFCGVVTSNPNSKLDPRGLILFGLVLSIGAMWQLGHLSADSGTPDTFWPLLVRGLSLGFMMIPINAVSIASLGHDDVQQGVSLLGLARQLGGSFGVAMLATYYDNHTHVVRASLVGDIAGDRSAYQSALSQFTGVFTEHGYSAASAQQGAMGVIDHMLTIQTWILSFNAAFILLMIISIAIVPLLLLMRKPKPGASAAAMH